MDRELFRTTCEKIVSQAAAPAGGRGASGGIGTLGEKTLHAVLKHYYEPDISCHEVKIGSYVADIFRENAVTEIQTRQFNKLRDKLDYFLEQYTVTVVYPIPRTKWLIWMNGTTGEVTKRRKSPKVGTAFDAFGELYKIKSRLCHPRLRICLALLDIEEYRLLNGWSRDRKKGSWRYDRIPVDIAGELIITSPADYAQLIPASLHGSFTSGDFKAAAGIRLHDAQTALNVLHAVGALARTGKKGSAYLYEKIY